MYCLAPWTIYEVFCIFSHSGLVERLHCRHITSSPQLPSAFLSAHVAAATIIFEDIAADLRLQKNLNFICFVRAVVIVLDSRLDEEDTSCMGSARPVSQTMTAKVITDRLE